MSESDQTLGLTSPRPTWQEDVVRIWRDRHVWWLLAVNDIRSQYRHSTLGTLWITATTGVFAVTIGVIYGQFFGQDIASYLPYFATGFIIWTFLSGATNEVTRTLIGASSLIQTSRMPISFHVMRMMAKNLLVFAHNITVIVAIWLWFRWPVDLTILLAVPGFLLLFVTLVSGGLALAIVCVRFRDIPPLVQAVTQFVFFASPIIWFPEQIKIGKALVWANPVSHYLAVVRGPLLDRPVPVSSWIAVVIVTVACLLLAAFVYRRYRNRVAFWV